MARGKQLALKQVHMHYNLNSFEGAYEEDYIEESYRTYLGGYSEFRL